MRAKRSLGQNFLRDETIIRRIVEAVGLQGSDTVVEIGPGHGALTQWLIEEASLVFAVEFDRDLLAGLESRFGSKPNFKLIEADALQVDLANLARLLGAKLKVVANLPYNISTPILQRLISQREVFSTLVLMFQREVVERITAEPGNKARGYLTVLVEDAFESERLFDVPPTAFWPMPKVWSSVVRLTPKPKYDGDERQFRTLLSTAFGQKRKTLLNNLRLRVPDAGNLLLSSGIDPSRRAETLTLDEWHKLAGTILSEGSIPAKSEID